MFWIIVGIVIGVAFLASAFVLYIIGVGLKETEKDYNNGYKNPFE